MDSLGWNDRYWDVVERYVLDGVTLAELIEEMKNHGLKRTLVSIRL